MELNVTKTKTMAFKQDRKSTLQHHSQQRKVRTGHSAVYILYQLGQRRWKNVI